MENDITHHATDVIRECTWLLCFCQCNMVVRLLYRCCCSCCLPVSAQVTACFIHFACFYRGGHDAVCFSTARTLDLMHFRVNAMNEQHISQKYFVALFFSLFRHFSSSHEWDSRANILFMTNSCDLIIRNMRMNWMMCKAGLFSDFNRIPVCKTKS